MKRIVLAYLTAATIGCGGGTPRDAGSEAPATDVPVDGAPDVPVDSAPDVPVDGAPDVVTPQIRCGDEGLLSMNDKRLIDVFVAVPGIIVVQEDAILLVGRDRQTKTLPSARPITAAAFDGQTLVVADAATLTAYSPALVKRSEVLLTRSCRALALMDSGVAICGVSGNYFTYDVQAGKLVAQSSIDPAFSGDAIRPVPGTADFVTWSQSLYLYQVEAAGSAVRFVDGSKNTGSFIGNGVFAFSTPSAIDLINWEGRRFLNRGDDCTPVDPFLQKGRCFTADGQLDTLPDIGGGQKAHYVALANEANGELVGLVSESTEIGTRPFITQPCGTAGCLLQRIDYPSRTVAEQRRLDIAPKTVLGIRADSACGMAVVAYQVPGALSPTASEWTGYRVDLIGFRAPPGSDGGAPADGGSDLANDGPSAGGDGGADAVDSARPSTGCAAVGLLDTGTSPLVNAFVVPDGIIVVRTNSIALIGRDRSVKKMVTAPAPISTASFDGETLATADTAYVNVYTSTLVAQGTVPLRDACFESIIAPGGVFVCENPRPAALVLTTFDLRGRRFLKEYTDGFLSAGWLMEPAPGTPYFALQVAGSPRSYGLYAVDSDGTVRTLGGAQVSDNLNNAFGFAGAPSSHLVLATGELRRMLSPTCTGTGMGQSGCLQPDGVLGTLQTRDRFVALDSDGAGTLIGFVSHTGSEDAFDDAPCRTGCALQKLDVPQRLVIAQREHVINARKVLFVRHDPACNMAAVGYQAPAISSQPPTFPYQVDLLDYLP